MEKDLFYSSKEGIAFWVSGYGCTDSGNVTEIIRRLAERTATFVEMTGAPCAQVQTRMVNKSRRYEGMRVFSVLMPTAPTGAFDLGNDWTMRSWLEN